MASPPPVGTRGRLRRKDDQLGVDLLPLPATIRQQLAWRAFRIITQDSEADITHMRALVRRLGEAISDLGAAGHLRR